MTVAPVDPDLFDRARKVSVEDVAGVRLFRVGQMLRGECCVCGSGKGKRAGGPFWTNPDTGKWGCFAGGGDCAEGGDVVELEFILRGGSRREAAARLAGEGYRPAQGFGGSRPTGTVRYSARPGRDGRQGAVTRREEGPSRGPVEVSGARDLALQLLARARPAGVEPDCPVRSYLAGRGLAGPLADLVLQSLKVVREAPFRVEDDAGRPRTERVTAMLAIISYPGPDRKPAWTGGVHCTGIVRDGAGIWRKAALDPAKRMFGPTAGPDGQPGGVWVIGPSRADPGAPLIVAEGIESTASAAELWRRRGGVTPLAAAALSLNRLQGGWLADSFGRRDVEQPVSDPDTPAFRWPGVDWVVGAVDRDMRGLKAVKVRGPGGRTMRRPVSGEERTRICGSLFRQAWLRAGAGRVEVIAPGLGRDFSDELMAEGAGA